MTHDRNHIERIPGQDTQKRIPLPILTRYLFGKALKDSDTGTALPLFTAGLRNLPGQFVIIVITLNTDRNMQVFVE
jgi:hypothetical protein